MSPRRLPAWLATLVATLACAGAPGPASLEETDPADRERAARRLLEDARVFRSQGRLGAAERALERGLALAPDGARLHRGLADVLAAQGRDTEAARHRRRADALDPPPPPPPDAPLDLPSRGVLVALLPPREDAARESDLLGWPDGPAAAALEQRLARRLPQARRRHVDPGSVSEARRLLAGGAPRAALSLRVDRAHCDETVKDGRFALAWLRAAVARPGAEDGGRVEVREVVLDPRLPGGCRHEALARALERVLAAPAVREALAGTAADTAWRTPAIRALFPGIGAHIESLLARGLAQQRAGAVAAAAEFYERAARLDPDDPTVRAHREEAAAALAMMRELPARPDLAPRPAGTLDPRLSPAQRAAAEAQLAEERRRREELLAALAVLDEDVAAPPVDALDALHPVEIDDPDAFGPRVARERAGGAVQARAAYAPGGALLARYYLPRGDGPDAAVRPVLREEDLDGDGRGDRWIGYAGDRRSEIWEDSDGEGGPDVHLVFGLGGSPLERIELDADEDGAPERVFEYGDGDLRRESRDADGDGVLDCFDRFDGDGDLVERSEDLDGDGVVDRRSVFEQGRLVRRELRDPALAPDAPGLGCATRPAPSPPATRE